MKKGSFRAYCCSYGNINHKGKEQAGKTAN